MDLEDIRLKDASELEDDEKEFLKEHSDDLNDEEKETFKDFLGSDDDEDEDKGFGFKTKEDFEAAVTEKARALIQEELAKKGKDDDDEDEDKDKDKGVINVFDKSYKAPDWNEPFNKALPALVTAVIKEIQGMNDKQRAELDRINQGFETEIEGLRKSNPEEIPKAGTEERKTFDKDLAQIGVKYRLQNMTQAFEIYQKDLAIKKAGGGGDEKKTADEKAKALARKVSGGGKGGDASGKSRSYADLHNKSLDELMDEAKAKAGFE